MQPVKRSVLFVTLLLIACDGGDRGGESLPRSDVPRASGTAQGAVRCTPGWREVGEGIRYQPLGCNEQGEFDLHVVEVDPARVSIGVVRVEPTRASHVAALHGAKFTINTNFFDENDAPLGLIASGGKVLQRPRPVSWQSLFLVDAGGEARIVTHDSFERYERAVRAGVQAGPRLVIAGERNQVATAEPSLRSGVCVTSDDRLQFFVTPHERLFDVREMVTLAYSKQALGCRDAMLFDGGPSAQMYLDRGDGKIVLDGDNVPVFITVK